MCEIVGADWPAIFPDALDHRIWLVGNVPDLVDRIRPGAPDGSAAALRGGYQGQGVGELCGGVPCVMTSIAAEGLPLTPGVRRLVADNPDQIAELICLLHADAEPTAKPPGPGLACSRTTSPRIMCGATCPPRSREPA